MGSRNGREEDAEKLSEGYANGGDGPRLDDQEERPPEEKTPERPQRLAQIDILAAGLGHHRRQFAVAKRSNQGENGGHYPGAQEEGRRAGSPGNVGIDDVN